MPPAIDIGIAEMPLWVLIVAGFLLLLALGWWSLGREGDFAEFPGDEEAERLAIPYYVEREGLRSLAASFRIELPLTREVTRQRRLMARVRGFGGERAQSETRQYSGEIDLSRLVRMLDEKLDYDACARDLADVPMVEDRQVLSDAISHLDRSVGETSQTRELLRQVEEVYDRERSETVVKQKRDELREVGERQKLILMRGQFNVAPGGATALIVLTHFDPPPYYRGYGPEAGETEAKPLPVPDGVGIRIALPDESAFTPAGKERINRGDRFYARIIAHSPSHNSETGMLSCAAYAIWGTNRPRPNREHYHGC